MKLLTLSISFSKVYWADIVSINIAWETQAQGEDVHSPKDLNPGPTYCEAIVPTTESPRWFIWVKKLSTDHPRGLYCWLNIMLHCVRRWINLALDLCSFSNMINTKDNPRKTGAFHHFWLKTAKHFTCQFFMFSFQWLVPDLEWWKTWPHLVLICLSRCFQYPPPGPWSHVFPVWVLEAGANVSC